MNTLTPRTKQHTLASLCVLTIALSFAATQLPIPGEEVPVVMVFILALVALGLTAIADGWGDVRALLGRLMRRALFRSLAPAVGATTAGG